EHQVKFIDFELAYELDRDDLPIHGWTEGYASPEQLSNNRPTPEEDYYALGSLIVDLINVTASGLSLNREGVLTGLKQILDDFGLPQVFCDVVRGLTDPALTKRWRPEQTLRALDGLTVSSPDRLIDLPPGDGPVSRPDITDELKTELETTVSGITDFILNKVTYERADRLWPASGEVFVSGPISIQYGATGTAFYLWRTGQYVPEAAINWILERAKPDTCPPGLYVGLSGVALFLLDIGRVEKAKEILAMSHEWDRIFEVPGLYDGAAGWGLANLHFWRATGEKSYLENALEVGEHLLSKATSDPQGLYWESEDMIPLGFGFGPTGIATFLLYLNAARADERFLIAAEKALDYETAQAEWVGNRLLLYTHKDAPISSPKSPSMRHGSGGIGTASVRFYAVTGEARFKKLADAFAYVVSSRYTNKLWQDYGPSGWAEVLLDLYWFLDDENYLNAAAYLASHILQHKIYKPERIA